MNSICSQNTTLLDGVVHTYQLHVSASILAIFRLYLTYKTPIQNTIYVECLGDEISLKMVVGYD